MRPLSILYVTPYYPPDYAGGGRLAHGIAVKLPDQFKITVLTKHQTQTITKQYSTDVHEGIKVIRVKKAGRGAIHKLFSVINLATRMIEFSHEYSAVHFVGIPNEVFILTIVAKLLGKKVVSTMELLGDDDLYSIKKQPFGKIKIALLKLHKWIGGRSDIVLSESRKITELSNKLIELPVAVDMNKYVPIEQSERPRLRDKLFGTKINAETKVIIFAGALGERKGVDLIVDFIEKNEDFIVTNNLFFLLIGPVEDKDVGERLDDLKNKKYLYVIKGLPPEEVIPYYQASDLFVFPSRREGFGMVALEARACGLPCFVSDIAPMRQIFINGENGVLFKTENYDSFEKELMELVKNGSLLEKIRAVTRSTIDKKYTMDDLIERHVKYYSELV
jgi:glycosyltransferase involved in cell wall biosynthesis